MEENKDYRDLLIDTYDIMTEEERLEFIMIKKIKANIKYFVGVDRIIEMITNLIDNTKFFDFLNERTRKYISKNRPVFMLKIHFDEFEKEEEPHDFEFLKSKENDFFINGKTNSKYNFDIDYLQQKAFKEIIEPFSDELMTFLNDGDKFMSILKENGVDNITLDEDKLRLMTITSAVLFSVRVDLVGRKLLLEYAL